MTQHKYDTDNLRSTCAQVVASLSFSILSFNVGFIFGMPTIVIGALRKEDSVLTFTESQASWFGSLIFFIQPLGSLVSAFFQENLGRKLSLILVNIPMLIAWIILYFAPSVELMFSSVALMGLSMGFLEAPTLSYVGEITQPRLRGILCCFAGVFYNLGFMVISFMGVWMDWRTVVMWSIIGPVVAFTVLCLMPDSPAWLVAKGRVSEAEKAYQWLRGWVAPEVIKEELDAMVDYVRQTKQAMEYSQVPTHEGGSTKVKARSWWELLIEPEMLVAQRIVFLYFIIMACTSLFGMRPFFIEILEKADVPIEAHVVVAVCGCLQMAGSVFMGFGIRFIGKRGMSFLSLSVCVFCCYGLGAYFLLKFQLPWLPVILFSLSYFGSAIGILAIPWLLIIELYPLRARGIGGGLGAAVAYILMFLVTKTYYNIVNLVGESGSLLFYGSVGLLGLFYLYVDMPETEGHSLEDIEQRLSERIRKASSKKTDNSKIRSSDSRIDETSNGMDEAAKRSSSITEMSKKKNKCRL